MLLICKDSCSWQQDEGYPAKQYVIGFIREVSMHVGQWSAFRLPHATVRPEGDGLLNIEIGSNMIGTKCCLQASPDTVWSVTPDVFWYGRKGVLEITPKFVRKRSQYRRSGWMVWGGGISICGHTDLHIIRDGTLTARKYADDKLRPHVIPCVAAIGDSFIFHHNYARPHTARLVENMLQAETIQHGEWPSCCPDINTIDHVWDMLGRRIAARPRPPFTLRDLEIALIEEWNNIPQSLIDNIIASMENRCAAVLAVRGDNTPY